MGKKTLKTLLWERLSTPNELLDLDSRTDEEPEDHFARLYKQGQKAGVVKALSGNLYDIVVEGQLHDKPAGFRFLQRALQLCDILGDEKLKPVLKYLLLHEYNETWRKQFLDIQILAVRALDGIPKTKSEFKFWYGIAEKRDESLPYALNAVLEIDLS